MSPYLKDLLETWEAVFSDHASLRTAIEFLHVGGLTVGGGCAIFADRLTLRAFRRKPEERNRQLELLRGAHRVVVGGLAAVMVSGVLLFASDTETFLYSTVFWIKIVFVAALLVNGFVLVSAERGIEAGDDERWNRLAFTSTLSIVLWLGTTLLGAALPNLG